MTTPSEEEAKNYEKLLNSFRKREVILFIGAGSSRGIGLPTWEQLLCKIAHYFSKTLGENFSKKQREMVEELFECQKQCPCKTQIFYSEIAEIFRQCNCNLYEKTMCDLLSFKEKHIFSKCYIKDHERQAHQTYLENLFKLPVNGIITTNYDLVFEQKLESLRLKGWESFTWKDVNSWKTIDKFVRTKNFIFHLHGKIDQFDSVIHTTTEYKSLYGGFHGNENVKVRTFSNLLFTFNTVLFIGYRLGDPIIPQVKKFISDSFGLIPSWYQLIPKGEQQLDCVQEENDPIQLTYPLGATDYPYTSGLSRWVENLGRNINQCGIVCKFTILATNKAMESIVFQGLIQYIESIDKVSYETFDFVGVHRSDDWMEYQVNSSTAIIIICDTTVTIERVNAWLAAIRKHDHEQKLLHNSLAYIYEGDNCDKEKLLSFGIKLASSCTELENFINSVVSKSK